ncbi:hypothetical protein TeGR_g11440, partial [Tetraparma gracilis]
GEQWLPAKKRAATAAPAAAAADNQRKCYDLTPAIGLAGAAPGAALAQSAPPSVPPPAPSTSHSSIGSFSPYAPAALSLPPALGLAAAAPSAALTLAASTSSASTSPSSTSSSSAGALACASYNKMQGLMAEGGQGGKWFGDIIDDVEDVSPSSVEVLNAFTNFNAGEVMKDGASGSVGSEGNPLAHSDVFSPGSNVRGILYSMDATCVGGGGLTFTYQPTNGTVLRATVDVPSGCMFWAGPEVLCGPILHAHEARGPCLTTVVEMFVEGFYEFQVSDQQQVQDAADKQVAEMLNFPSFNPALAKGSPCMFYGAGVSLLASSTGRETMACLAALRGPRLGRGRRRLMPRQQAKDKILAMSVDERAEMAAKFWARKEADVKLEEFEAEERRLCVKYSQIPDGEKRACREATEFAEGKAKKRFDGRSRAGKKGGRHTEADHVRRQTDTEFQRLLPAYANMESIDAEERADREATEFAEGKAKKRRAKRSKAGRKVQVFNAATGFKGQVEGGRKGKVEDTKAAAVTFRTRKSRAKAAAAIERLSTKEAAKAEEERKRKQRELKRKSRENMKAKKD